jgi:hypothetical protein
LRKHLELTLKATRRVFKTSVVVSLALSGP